MYQFLLLAALALIACAAGCSTGVSARVDRPNDPYQNYQSNYRTDDGRYYDYFRPQPSR